MSREAKWIWNADTPATVPAGARISAGKSGSVARSFPNTAVASVNRLPASCMPSPESPAMRTTTRSRVSLAFTLRFKPVSSAGCNGLGVEETPHHVACPIVRRINNNGVELAFSDSGAGTPPLLIHGYPDSSVLWRHQIDPLSQAGLRVIAPDLRGFGESGKPEAVDDYAIGHGVGDMIAIFDALDIERAHVVGHDWGAGVAWAMAILAPERVDRLVALSVGHPEAWAAKTLEDRKRSWYVLLFQFPEAQELLRRNDFALAREWLATHPDRDDVLETLVSTPALNWYR